MSSSQAERSTELVALSWDVFCRSVTSFCGIEASEARAETPIKQLFPGGPAASIFGMFLAKLTSRPSPDLAALPTFGDAFVWCRENAAGALVSRDFRKPIRKDQLGSPVRLRPIRAADLLLMYEAAQEPSSSFRWRFRGAFPSPAQFQELAFRGVWNQLVVESKGAGAAAGVVIAYDALPEFGCCFLAFQRIAPAARWGEMTYGMFHFVEHLFERWPFRKLFIDLPEFNLHLVERLPVVRGEGRLREFSYYDGAYWDRCFFSITREDWERQAEVWREYMADVH